MANKFSHLGRMVLQPGMLVGGGRGYHLVDSPTTPRGTFSSAVGAKPAPHQRGGGVGWVGRRRMEQRLRGGAQ